MLDEFLTVNGETRFLLINTLTMRVVGVYQLRETALRVYTSMKGAHRYEHIIFQGIAE